MKKKMILTNENNIDTTFKEVDILESFDDIINRFPTPTETGMPGIKIYGDNTDQSKAKRIKLCNDAIQYRSNYISNNGLSDTGQKIRINVDAVLIDNIIMDKYDGNYNYYIDIYNGRYGSYFYLNLTIHNRLKNILSINNDGDIFYYVNNIFPSPTNTASVMPGLKIYTDNTEQSKLNNIELYNDAQQYRKDYISNNLSDKRQPISMMVNVLIIDDETIDKYDNTLLYKINIYDDRIILLKGHHYEYGTEILTIYGDGSVEKYTTPTPITTTPAPTPDSDTTTTTQTPDSDTTTTTTDTPDSDTTTTTTDTPDSDTTTTNTTTSLFPTDGSTQMSKLNIYLDNNDQSRLENRNLYYNAQKYRNNYISNNGLSDTSQPIRINVDALLIDNNRFIDYDDGYYNYYIDIYYNCIILLNSYDSEVLTISSDGSVQFLFNKFPSNTSTNMPSIKIYTDNTSQSKANNIELYNNAQEWRDHYISYHGSIDTGQGIDINFNQLVIDNRIIDKYDTYYNYHIDIYNNNIILRNFRGLEILTISSDGYVTITNPI